LAASGTASSFGAPSVGITFQNVEKTFGVFAALRNLSLEILPGEFVALLGPNGAGKTTLLRIAALLSNPTRGTIRFHAGPIDTAGSISASGFTHNPKTLLGMVGHSILLYDELTAAENLQFFAELYGLGDVPRLVAAALEDCGLTSRAGSLVRTFSRGMRQRLAIARVLLTEPRLLLLDEPAAGLDRQGLAWFGSRLEGLKAGGCTIVMSTHARNEALDLATRVVSLAAGRVEHDSGSRGDPAPLLAALKTDN
jgi:heme exporter protein A